MCADRDQAEHACQAFRLASQTVHSWQSIQQGPKPEDDAAIDDTTRLPISMASICSWRTAHMLMTSGGSFAASTYARPAHSATSTRAIGTASCVTTASLSRLAQQARFANSAPKRRQYSTGPANRPVEQYCMVSEKETWVWCRSFGSRCPQPTARRSAPPVQHRPLPQACA